MSKSEEIMNAFGYLFPEERLLLQELVRSLPDNPQIVNIGAGAGTSALAMLEARPDSFVTTVDINEDGPLGSLQGERNALAGTGLEDRLDQILGDSKEVCKEYYNGEQVLDVVFIDGDHSREGVRGDIAGWMPLIKEGGILSLHDYDKTEKKWHEVTMAVNELLVPNYELLGHADTTIAFRVTHE